MIGGDRIHSTALGLSQSRAAKTSAKIRIVNQLDDGVRKSASRSVSFTREDHSGVTIPDIACELRQITHDWHRSTGHRLERSDG